MLYNTVCVRFSNIASYASADYGMTSWIHAHVLTYVLNIKTIYCISDIYYISCGSELWLQLLSHFQCL